MRLQCDYRDNPIGIDLMAPTLSWAIQSAVRGQKQTKARIVVSSSLNNFKNGVYDMWDETFDGSATAALYAGKALAARHVYYWTIFVSDKDGKIITPTSYASFETGLFGDFGESNYWITAADRNFDNASATLVANMTLSTKAVGLNFCQNEQASEYLMWQVSVANGTPVLRPHQYTNRSYSTIAGDISLTSIFPTLDSIVGKSFELKLVLENGTVTTYVNGTKVSTISSPLATRIGKPEIRVTGTENGTLNGFKLYDGSNQLIYSTDKYEPYLAPYFRKGFETLSGKEISHARLYVTAAGCHEMYLNGVRTDDTYLAPGKSTYNELLYYQTYNVTNMIQEGENTLAGLVGMGWYNSGAVASQYGTGIGLKAKLVVSYTDGTEQTIDTDGTWLATSNGPITANRFYTGEHYDARKEIDKWNQNGADLSAWTPVNVLTNIGYIKNNFEGEDTNPVRLIREVHPVSYFNPSNNVYVYAFPANIVGTLRFEAEATRGTEIVFRYSEHVDAKGAVDTSAYNVSSTVSEGDQNGVDRYIFAGNGKEGTTFTLVYHGFQYVEITGLSEPLPLDAITGLVISTDNERTGNFESSNELLNQWYQNVISSQEGNFVSAITDCPTREKNNWTGDAQGFAYAASYNYNVYNIYRAFQLMTVQSQGVTGIIPEIVPSTSPASATSKAPSGWSDCVVLIPWQMYFQYGDINWLTENYDAMKKWADYLISTCKDNGYVRKDGWYGDNLPYDMRMMEAAAYPEIGTAYSAYTTKILSRIASILGDDEACLYYAQESEKFAKAWRTNFLEADGYTCKTNTQTSYAMGLYYDLYENAEKKQFAADKLAALIASGDAANNIPANVQTVGFIGYPILYYVLSQNGHADTAFTLLEQTQCPSLLYSVTKGATTTWETYYKHRSLNHFFPGCVSSWLYSDVLGISHDYEEQNVGYQHFVLRPTYGGSLTYAKGSYLSQSGLIESEWKLSEDGKTFTYDCVVPANTSATLMIPIEAANASITENGVAFADAAGVTFVGIEDGRAIFEIESGVYHITVVNP